LVGYKQICVTDELCRSVQRAKGCLYGNTRLWENWSVS
jgi:hypothetical protein